MCESDYRGDYRQQQEQDEYQQQGYKMKTQEEQQQRLSLLRNQFEPHQISKLPKPTKQQTDEVKADFTKGIRCQVCGGWHHPKVVHLDYVGHAALTDRLLDVDAAWSWEPLAFDTSGFPSLDKDGGMWIKLTVCGVTRLGYGDAQGKSGGDATKERIGDALRNAAMRFGAALDLWHKGDLHLQGDTPEDEKPKNEKPKIAMPQAKEIKQTAPNTDSPAPSIIDCTEIVMAEAGEVAYINNKIAALKINTVDEVLEEAGLASIENLTKDGFIALRNALKGKK